MWKIKKSEVHICGTNTLLYYEIRCSKKYSLYKTNQNQSYLNSIKLGKKIQNQSYLNLTRLDKKIQLTKETYTIERCKLN